MRLLIVEDELDTLQVMSSLLKFVNIQSDAATSAEEAIHQLEQNQYDGVIIDFALPGMDGFGLLSEIRANTHLKDLPCIAVTAFHSAEVKKQATEAGFNGYFAKPVNTRNFANDILAVIRKN